MKKLLLLSLTIIILALTGGCGAPKEGTSQEKALIIGDTTFSSEHWEETVDPHRTYNGWACIRYGIGETLVRYSDNMELEPWLAKSWSHDGSLTWTITLQDNIKFSNGRPMDAAAVKECLDHLLQVHDRAPVDTKIASIEAQGQQLLIKTKEPNPALMNYLGDPYGCIIDVQASDFTKGIVIGTGPYKVATLVPDKELTVIKNAAYWQQEPKLDKITIRTITNGDTLAAALEAGSIDAAYGIAYEAYPRFENKGFNFSSVKTSRAFLVSLNMESSILQEAAVRRAIAMGINKEAFVNSLLQGHGMVGQGAFPAGFANFGGDKVAAPAYNPKAAKALLEQAGWVDSDGDGIREKNGTKLKLRWLTYPSRQELPLLAQAAQASLRQLGIEVEINCTASRRQFLADKRTWDLYGSALVTAPSGDPESFFTTSCLPGSNYNFGGYNNPQVTKMVQQLSKEFGQKARGRLALKLQQALIDDNAFIFCSFLEMNMLSKSSVVGYEAHPCDYYQVTAKLDKKQ